MAKGSGKRKVVSTSEEHEGGHNDVGRGKKVIMLLFNMNRVIVLYRSFSRTVQVLLDWMNENLSKRVSKEIKLRSFGLGYVESPIDIGEPDKILSTEGENSNQPSSSTGVDGGQRDLFALYLKSKNCTSHCLSLEKSSIARLAMTWLDDENKVDCGVFAMRHLEIYMGGGTRNWDSRL